jgi:hypothetical protein
VAKFTHILPGAPRNYDRNDQGREDHRNTQGSPDHAPTDIFKKPENNVQVFHLTIMKWNIIILFGCHMPQNTRIIENKNTNYQIELHELIRNSIRVIIAFNSCFIIIQHLPLFLRYDL